MRLWFVGFVTLARHRSATREIAQIAVERVRLRQTFFSWFAASFVFLGTTFRLRISLKTPLLRWLLFR